MKDALRAPVLKRDELRSWGVAERAAGRTVAFTNGCFDLLHPGHRESLEIAAAAAGSLLVAVNSDSSVRELKGPARPLLPESERAKQLSSLRAVDAVTIFAEPTPLEVILQLRPDVLVKGSEYDEEDIVGAREVKSWGGRIVRVPMRAGWSTSQIIASIRDRQ